MSEIKDSGTRRDFGTGSVRDAAENKGRFDLLPEYAIQALALHFEGGAKKYGDDNWRMGQPLKVYLDSALRHLFRFSRGEEDEPHLLAGAWNVLCLIDTLIRINRGLLPMDLNNLRPAVPNEACGNVTMDDLKRMGPSMIMERGPLTDEQMDALIEKVRELHSSNEAWMEKVNRESEKKLRAEPSQVIETAEGTIGIEEEERKPSGGPPSILANQIPAKKPELDPGQEFMNGL